MEELVRKAYKKLKSSVYFDKTQLILRNKIVEYESKKNFEASLLKIARQLEDEKEFNKLTKEIFDSISIVSFPKTLFEEKSNEEKIIFNLPPQKVEVQDMQHLIDMDVRGHILGVLWIMLVGYRIDKTVYEHSYGNRIRKGLYNELSGKPTYSPYLFEPYFEQYESWRDKAMDEASKHLNLGQDVVIVTMDFKRYYYSVDMDYNAFGQLFKDAFPEEIEDKKEMQLRKRLNNFVCGVILQYASLFDERIYKGRRILPIGFLPSNVIGNWYLKNFDKAIVDGWNPIYFGRYVDDVIIVDKVERNSDIYMKAKEDKLCTSDIINFFLLQCSKWLGLSEEKECKDFDKKALLQEDKEESNSNTGIVYHINSRYNAIPYDKAKITVQNKKVKIFYFKSGETDALITCFRDKISKNKSEFRHMPEDEAYFQHDDYTEIYHLNSSDSPNKLRAIEGISVDKYELSKYIGKHLRIGGLIDDKTESKFEKDIHRIFNRKVIIENYTCWEKVIEIFVINEKFNTAQCFIENIMDAIEALEYEGDDKTVDVNHIKRSLFLFLHSAICRSFALIWKKECIKVLDAVYEKLEQYIPFWVYEAGLKQERKNYCRTRMIDKAVMPIAIDMLKTKEIFRDEAELNLTCFNDVLMITKKKWKGDYIFYPYLLNMYDFSIIMSIEEFNKENSFGKVDELLKDQLDNYTLSNYAVDYTHIADRINIHAYELNIKNTKAYEIGVGSGKKGNISIAIANVKLDHRNFELLVKGKPNRSFRRYKDLSQVVNAAIDSKVDMLIMPELYVPYEWLSVLARTCAKNNLAIITGIEYVKFGNRVFNLTAVILPYKEEDYSCAHISFHLKKHYAPIESQEICGYRLEKVQGTTYELYKWNDCYFPVYCCYELASIDDRALFQSYADFMVAIEWNKDTNYYSNILEALSRDIHCYCVQVNSSDYGDSRITKPSKTEEKDLIRTKGGKNSTILVDTIDIDSLRDFQLKEYELQRLDKRFKVTPPDFNADIILKKINGEMLA